MTQTEQVMMRKQTRSKDWDGHGEKETPREEKAIDKESDRDGWQRMLSRDKCGRDRRKGRDGETMRRDRQTQR